MNEVQQEMLKSAGLLHDVADEFVTAIEGGDYQTVSESAAITGEAMHGLARLALAAGMQMEELRDCLRVATEAAMSERRSAESVANENARLRRVLAERDSLIYSYENPEDHDITLDE